MFGFFGRKKLKIESHAICDCGLARTENQDCVFENVAKGIFCVADGMGGGAAGEVASRMVCDAVSEVSGDDFQLRVMALCRAIFVADRQIRAYAAEKRHAQMGTTVAALLIDPVLPAKVAVLHVGDSRVYRRRVVRFECLTQDHRHTAYSHMLTRAVGMGASYQPDYVILDGRPGDIWLVCSDGVHEMLPASTINALMARGGSAAEIAERISLSVRKAGARDNYSIIVIRT